MQKKLVIYLLILLISVSIFAGLFPYPIFSAYTNVTESNMTEITNFKETELNTQTENKISVLSLDWNTVSPLLEIGKEYHLIDLKTGINLIFKRLGGINHADIEPIDNENTQLLQEMSNENASWERIPCYVEINDNLFISASLVNFPHGDSKLDNNMEGHLCLHFKNSKTHGTNIVDKQHQKAIKYAQKQSSKIFELI